jgi:hypothetical protein
MAAILDLYSTFARALAPTHAAVIVGIGLEWKRGPNPKFVQPGCTATTNRIQVSEMLLNEGVEAYKKGRRQAEGQGQRLMTGGGKAVPC